MAITKAIRKIREDMLDQLISETTAAFSAKKEPWGGCQTTRKSLTPR